jgi:putative lipoprotein
MPTNSCNASPLPFFRALGAGAAAAVALAACQPVQRPDAAAHPSAVTTHPTNADTALIHVRATYLERILLPPGATLDVQFIEEGPDAAHTKVLVTQHASNLQGPPFAVDVPYDPSTIAPGLHYGLRASLREADGRLAFVTGSLVPVVPGNAAAVEFRLVRADAR